MKIILLSSILFLTSCARFESKGFIRTKRDPNAQFAMTTKRDGRIIQDAQTNKCVVRWNYHKGTIHVETFQCNEELKETVWVLDELLKRLRKKLKKQLDIKYFVINIRNFIDIEKRITVHTYHSDDWDHKLGKPKDSDTKSDEFIRDYANSYNAFWEIKAIFADQCYDLNVFKVSDVSIFRASSLPYYPWLRKQRVKRRAKIPAAYTLKMDIKAKHERCFPDEK